MSIKTKQIKEYVVDPVLEALGLGGNITMLAYAAQESHMGTWIEQIGKGIHGCGLWMVEHATHDDVWRYLLREDDPNNTLEKRYIWRSYLALYFRQQFCLSNIYHDHLIYDLRYCCAIARLKLYMIPAPLPAEDDIQAMAEYWDKNYNCNAQHGTPAEFVKNYEKYVRPYV
jgi:hypothetical protein